jgi:hypothetical protein
VLYDISYKVTTRSISNNKYIDDDACICFFCSGRKDRQKAEQKMNEAFLFLLWWYEHFETPWYKKDTTEVVFS